MVERIPLACLPTPLHPLPRLSAECGAEVWAKRDDLTGFALGGNKVRKAEWLLADARAQGATCVITAGAAQSNHARVIAAASAAAGITCRLVLSGPAARGAEPLRGNLLLDALAGAEVHPVDTGAEREPRMAELAAEERARGGRPYVVPIGGSNGVGARGYALCYRELAEQLAGLPPSPTWLVFATSSGGTYGGLLAGACAAGNGGPDIRLAGIRVDDDPGAVETVCAVASQALAAEGRPERPEPDDVRLDASCVGDGYGVPSPEGRAAQALAFRLEGLLLDLSYTAKAMAGLLLTARRGAYADGRVVFLHTGGEPAAVAGA